MDTKTNVDCDTHYDLIAYISCKYLPSIHSLASQPTIYLFTNEALAVSTVIFNKRLDSVTSSHVINIGVLGLASAISLCIVGDREVC